MKRMTRIGSAFLLALLVSGCLLCAPAPANATSVEAKDLAPDALELVAPELVARDKHVKPEAFDWSGVGRPLLLVAGTGCPALIDKKLATSAVQADRFPAGNSSARVVRLPEASGSVAESAEADVPGEIDSFIPTLRRTSTRCPQAVPGDPRHA